MVFDVPVNKDNDEDSSSHRGVSYPQDGDSAFTLVAKPQQSRDSDVLDTNSTLPLASLSNPENQLDIPDDSTEKSEDNPITFKEHLKLCEEYANFAENTWKRVSMAAISSGVYFIPVTSTESMIFEDFLETFSTGHDIKAVSRWSLEHRLFRDTANDHKYIQILDLSHHERNYISTTDTANDSPAVVVELASAEATDTYVEFMTTKLGPIWTLKQSLFVRDGQAFVLSDFTIRAGEVRQGGGANAMLRGIIVEISWSGDAENEGTEGGEEMIKELWGSFGVKNARECVEVHGAADRFRVVRQWCEILRLRT